MNKEVPILYEWFPINQAYLACKIIESNPGRLENRIQVRIGIGKLIGGHRFDTAPGQGKQRYLMDIKIKVITMGLRMFLMKGQISL
jgi:hypothetical protein